MRDCGGLRHAQGDGFGHVFYGAEKTVSKHLRKRPVIRTFVVDKNGPKKYGG
jgi:hypothetical protein